MIGYRNFHPLVTGLPDFVGTTASGWLSDRYSPRWLLFCYYGLRGLSLMYLPTAFGIASIGLPIFAVFYGAGNGLLLPYVMRFNLSERVPEFQRIAKS